MWTALRSRVLSLTSVPTSTNSPLSWVPIFLRPLQRSFAVLTPGEDGKTEILKLEEVEQVLSEVKASDVRVIPVGRYCDWTDYMVFATGRSTWHVRNIANALVYKAKQKQKEVERKLLPSVEGEESGKWIVVDSGTVMVHVMDEKARAYYDLETHWSTEKSLPESSQELAMAMVKKRRVNNSRKRPQKQTSS